MTYSLAVHGGAGTTRREALTAEMETAYHAGLAKALQAGGAVLSAGGTAVEAVVASVCALEDDPLFNAGRGAVFTSNGLQEMDAALMEGTGRSAGAVAGIRGPRNPIRAAKAVLERSPHVLLIGEGALACAREAGLAFEEDAYFFSQARWDALQSTLRMRAEGVEDDDPARRHGTVGAVARDAQGRLAAATSTGGMTAKAPGRVGDTAVIGAGTFADDATCAVSATGHGEIFIRWTAAAEIAARMRHAGQRLDQAAQAVVMEDLATNDGSGGLIAVNRDGKIAMPFNSEGMYRGSLRAGEEPFTAIFGREAGDPV